MKSKWHLFASIFQIIVGSGAVISFVILSVGGENMLKWIVTLILAIIYVIFGVIGIVEYKSNK